MTDKLILTSDLTKRCPRCGRELPVSHYHRSSKNKDGYQSWCIECKRDYNRQRALFRIARRVGINNTSISSVLGTLKSRTCGELTDTRIVLEEALNIVNNEIQSRKQ